MKSALFGLGFGSLILALSACGSSSDAPPSADSACTQIAAARCARVAACNVNGIQVRYGDMTTCEAAQKAVCLSSLSAASTGATPASTSACASALPGVACADYNDNLLPTACQPQVGKLNAGAACAFNAQCQSQFCGIGKNASCGVCQTQPKVNDSCALLSSCGTGLACVNKGTVCANEGAKTGAMCNADTPCGDGFSCVGAKAATASAAAILGTCQPAVEMAGAACDPKRKTGAGCDPTQGLVCDPTSMTCVAIVVANPGEACDGSLTVCSSAATCQTAAGANAGTCVAAAANGAPCDTVVGPDCLTLSRCIVSGMGTSGTCETSSDACTASTP
ncbi:MAG TPA: hypothetical protein VNW92_01510 [Polyangiaceae bacterium]|jgi:hypothetical protein|nr:hypothetical protein [Polyangiaceae bacterium]